MTMAAEMEDMFVVQVDEDTDAKKVRTESIPEEATDYWCK